MPKPFPRLYERIIRKCDFCGNDFEAILDKNKSGQHYCTPKCYHSFRAKNRKDEKVLQNLRRVKHLYGLDKDSYESLMQSSDGKCEICKKEFTANEPYIDHCHNNNFVRGLLCNNCNKGLGCFHDNIEILGFAIEYLINKRARGSIG